jgi:hypothetical protein
MDHQHVAVEILTGERRNCRVAEMVTVELGAEELAKARVASIPTPPSPPSSVSNTALGK